MLETSQRDRLLDRLALPPEGRRIVLHAVKFGVARKVSSKGGGNVLTSYQSRKMQRTIETESRHLEFPTAVGHEFDPEILEYYPQPFHLKFEATDTFGEIHLVNHFPDFLAITERVIWFEECKDWSRLESLARRKPWQYQLDPDKRWSSPLIEQWLGERGIGYRFRTDRDIPTRRIENFLLLQDYLGPDAPDCPIDVAVRVHEVLAKNATLYLADLYESADCGPEQVLKLIADGQLVSEIDDAPLNEPRRCRVFRDAAVREFERARHLPERFPLQGTVAVAEGARLTYDQQNFTVLMLGASKAVLQSESGETRQISLATLEELALQKDLQMTDGFGRHQEPVRLSDYSDMQLRMALERQERLRDVKRPNRTERRLLKALTMAKITGTDELVALVPRLHDRGNRVPRLTAEQEEAMERVIREEHLTNRAPNAKHCHRKLVVLCNQLGVKAPSYPTLIERIRALPRQESDRARHGKRVAYQNMEFVPVLQANTPVHGSRAFQYVHMDHTQVDIELVSEKTGKPLGRPWLSLAIDAFTRRILGLYLSYDPPSYRSNMVLLRDIVRRYRRLPQFLVVDNGADFRSEDFRRFAELTQIHLRYRPAGQPRHGAVMERIFGRANTEYIHNLAGNTKALKDVRQTTGKFLPSRLAEWTLENLYYGLEYWAFTYYDHELHPALNISPREAFERSVASTGVRSHRIVTLTEDFLILTCPTVGRMGQRIVNRRTGIKVHANYFYWCDEFRNPKLDGKKVPVRYDPWDCSTVYVQIERRWIPARCKALAGLGQLTEKEREVFSDELRNRYRLRENEEVTYQRLSVFMRVFSPKGAEQLALERQKENRELYERIGIGAISKSGCVPLMAHEVKHPVLEQGAATGYVPPTIGEDILHDLPTSMPRQEITLDEIPDFDTF